MIFFSKKTVLATTGIWFACISNTVAQSVPQLGHAPLKQVIAAMTLEEKAALVIGAGSAPRNAQSGLTVGHTDIKVPGAAGNTTAIPRLGIPSLVLSDGPAGVRITAIRKSDSTHTYYATGFPVGTLLASTWDTSLVTQVGRAFGNEVKEYGVDILLAPGVNIHRNPLNGRNFEYYSEDPLIAGKMAAAIINGIQSNGVGTSIKHFVANNQETNRNNINTIVSERTLREIYLKTFRTAITASNPWTVMSSYNKVNGTYTAERPDLLTTVLRDEWGFKGFVMSDWNGGKDWVAEMKAGNDLIMPGRPNYVKTIVNAVKHDSLSIKVLDVNVERILNIILKSPVFNNYHYSNHPDLKAHAALTRVAAADGMVLLKNHDKALPVNKQVKTVAAFGNASYYTVAGGTGSGDVNKAYTISIAQGLTNANYKLDTSIQNLYMQYIRQNRSKIEAPIWRNPFVLQEMAVNDDIITQKASSCDLAVYSIGRNSGEADDRKLETNYNLSDAEKLMLKKIAKSFHNQGKKLVIVLNIGGVIDMKDWQDDADAILLAWQPGQEAGNAIADILTGKVNPSGRLATTFPMRYNDVPSAKNFPGIPVTNPTQVTYEEGIYVGYRYYDTYKIKPLYEFGYGLSYTNFNISNLKLNSGAPTDHIMATATVKNTGSVAGKQVVQIYISAPAKTIDKPMQELKAFAKTRLLQPGETQNLIFFIPFSELASYHTDSSEWITDAGEYLLKVGASSQDTKQSAKFTIGKAIVIEKDHKVLQPQVDISEFRGATK